NIAHAPVLSILSILNSDNVNNIERYLLVGRSNTHKFSGMRAAQCLSRTHSVAIRNLVEDFYFNIGEAFTKYLDNKITHTLRAGWGSCRRSVIDDVVAYY